jgi:hypothetical protein
MANKYAVASGLWSATSTWSDSDGGAAGAAVPADNDAVYICTNVAVQMDTDLSAYTGLQNITIRGHATTPAMLYFKDGTSGYLKIRTGYNIVGSSGAAKGRLLANSDGVWGHTTNLAFTDKAVIDLGATSLINAQYLDIALYCYQPTTKYVRTYGVRHTVTADANTNTLTKASHGLANTTPVMIMSSGAIPAPLEADVVFYVVNTATNTFQLAIASGGTAIDLTDAGSGTIEVYTGAANGANPVNVFEDISAETGWTNATGHNRACVVSGGPFNYTYDQQRLTLSTLSASTITLSAVLDSLQYPGARIVLASRNVSIRSSCTTSVNVVNYSSSQSSGGVFQCELVATAGTGTTCYGSGLAGGTGHIVSGVIMGFSNGTYTGTSTVVSGIIVACTYAISYPYNITVSGTVMGCSNGLNGCSKGLMSGTAFGCQVAVNGSATSEISGTLVGNCYGVSGGNQNTISGTIKGCLLGLYSGTSQTLTGTIKLCNQVAIDRTDVVVTGVVGPGNASDFGFMSIYGGINLLVRIRSVATLPASPTYLYRNQLFDTGYDQGVFFENDGLQLGAARAVKLMGDIIKNTTIVRAGGAASSLEVIPQSNCSTNAPLKICEWTELDVAASAQNRGVYIKGEGWSSYPSAAELYFEAEYVSNDTTFTTTTIASTAVISDNTTWTYFSCAEFTPAVVSHVHYRIWLKKYGSSCKVYVDNQLQST